jgi:superfamily II DNA or RNA helicase
MSEWDSFFKHARVKTKLKSHQERVVERMKSEDQPGLVVAHGLGSGKTLTSIATQDALGLPATVAVPAALQANYRKEMDKHLEGTSPEASLTTLQRISRAGDIGHANPMLVVDEAHKAREINTKTYKALKKGIENTDKRLLLTASPFYNRPNDIAPLVNLAAGETVLEAHPTDFKKKYVKERVIKPGLIGKYVKGAQPGVVEELNPKQKAFLEGTFRKWVDYHPNSTEGFPEVKRQQVEVPMTQRQLQAYDAMMGTAPPWLAHKVKKGLPPSKQESKELNAFMSAVRQISNTTRGFSPEEKPQEPKIETAFNRMQDTLKKDEDAKGVVYSNFLESGLKPYKERLQKANIPFGEFTGDMKKKERDQLVRDYNEGKKKVLLLSSAGGEGLDLKGTRLMQVMEPHWNAEKLKQVEGRGIRFKSHDHLPPEKRNVTVENYLATRPPRKGLSKLVLGKDSGGSSDQYLRQMSEDKEKLIKQFRSLMEDDQEKTSAATKLVSPDLLALPHKYDLTPGSSSAKKVDHIAEEFGESGYDMERPPLVGYEVAPDDIQLLDGGHRAQAAQRAGIDVPVLVKSRDAMLAARDTPEWEAFGHTDTPAKDLLSDGKTTMNAADIVKEAKTLGGFYKGKPSSPDTVKKTVEFQGLKIKVDRPKGFIMFGEDSKGEEWKRKYKVDYGFIPKTVGGDGDGLDVFIGPNKKSKKAFWAVQRKDDGTFDEYKVFVGFDNRDEAVACYRAHIPKKYFGRMITMTVEMMKAMLGTNPDEVVEGVKTAEWAGFFDEVNKLAALVLPNKARGFMGRADELLQGGRVGKLKDVAEEAVRTARLVDPSTQGGEAEIMRRAFENVANKAKKESRSEARKVLGARAGLTTAVAGTGVGAGVGGGMLLKKKLQPGEKTVEAASKLADSSVFMDDPRMAQQMAMMRRQQGHPGMPPPITNLKHPGNKHLKLALLEAAIQGTAGVGSV